MREPGSDGNLNVMFFKKDSDNMSGASFIILHGIY